MKTNKNAEHKPKVLSILLTVALLTNIFGLSAGAITDYEREIQEKNIVFTSVPMGNPLEFMQDISVETRQRPIESERLSELPEEIRRELELREPKVDDGSTDRYIVKYKSGQRQNFLNKLSSKIVRSEEINLVLKYDIINSVSEWEVLTLSENILPSKFAESIQNTQALSDIDYIQPDYKLSLDSIDEEIFSNEEFLVNQAISIDAQNEITADIKEKNIDSGRDSITNNIIVAIIDTGIDIYHEYLSEYMDTNNMWDFTENTSKIYSSENPLEYAHGTHIAGIIANTARENSVENIKILPLRVFNNGVAYTSDIIAAIDYAAAKGAKIINCSFGSTQENPILEEVMANSGSLFICAVGNNRRDLIKKPSYPANYNLPNIISVASVNPDGGFSYFSNYGENIDIAALGRNIWSSLPENERGALTGTSMSAGYVTAVASIVKANEDLSAEELRYRLISTADKLSNLQNKVSNGRRINLANATNNIVQTNIIQNAPEDDFDVHGYQPTESELWELYSNAGNVEQIAVGGSHTLVLKSNGTVWAWGDNSYGQLGDGTTTNRTVPVQVTLNNIIAVSVNYNYSIALKSDGTVWTWGYNSYGQLGDGTYTNRTVPVQVTGLNGITAVSAGSGHVIALKSNGTIWAWGSNSFNQLGDDTTTNRTVPVQVTGLNGAIAVSAGDFHNISLKSDGTVWTWGDNSYGQLGDGTNTRRRVPVQVTGLNGVATISAGSYHSTALKSNGAVWTWGFNYAGQLGDGTNTRRTVPVQVTGLNGVDALCATGSTNVVLKNDGTVWAWGDNSYGQLGDGTTTNRAAPVQVTGLNGVDGIFVGDSTNMALKNDGTVWAWGDNYYGQLGDGTTQNSSIPIMSTLITPPIFIPPQISVNTDFIVICSLNNITSFSGKTYKITYNPAQVDLIDFAAQTPELNIGIGVVVGTDLQILTHNKSTGVLTFKVNKTVPSGKVWSGAVTILKFEAKVTGSTTVLFEKL